MLKEEVEKTGTERRSHPIFDTVQKFRQTFLDLGFTEIYNPIIVEEEDVYKQYGPEAAVILDRCYYLATLPRPEIGLGKDKREKLAKLGVSLTGKRLNNLRAVLRDYKKGVLSPDDFTERIAEALKIDGSKSILVIKEVFPEFAKLKPLPTKLTLRSHLTSAWFRTLQSMQERVELPIRFFSVDVKFRREQREDPTHLRSSITASCVIMDDRISVEGGIELTKKLLEPFGIKKLRFLKKKTTSHYYAPDTEYEVYAYFPAMKDWIEIANLGMYNPIALAQYGLEHPVLNVGIGVERVCMIQTKETDIRRLVYPQFYAEWKLSDEELAKMVRVNERPESNEGRALIPKIVNIALRYADAESPCEFIAFRGLFLGRKVTVSVYESEAGTKLLGPAALNEVYVYDGNILGIPAVGLERDPLVRKARKKGVKAGVRFLDSIASMAVARLEDAIERGEPKEVDVRVKMAKLPSDVNIKVSNVAQRYVTGKRRRIDLRGPVFVGIRAKIA